MSEKDHNATLTSEAIMGHLIESLDSCVAGGFIFEGDKKLILHFLGQPDVCAMGVLNTNMYASQSRTSFIYSLLNQAKDFLDKTNTEL
ncbi:MAG: hypothetical protein CMK30_04420 [Porticoccaceae bacterium]|nr:hypothetical protein [Porticoccaceae bacterium]|tara:strand:+ start:1792 stop:2055 length:264 start_codon:yes stop_codon:yes gene_type:complete